MKRDGKLIYRGTLLLASLIAALVSSRALVRAEDKAPKPEHVFLWKVSSPQGTAYLLGSIHVAKAGIYPLDDRIEKAFTASDDLVVEVNMTPEKIAAVAAKMAAKGVYPPGDSLEKHISPETLQATQAQAVKLGLSAEKLIALKPWFVSFLLVMRSQKAAGIESENGIDKHFEKLAADHKQILNLETADSQLDLFDSFNDQEQDVLLANSLKENDNLGKSTEQLTAAWVQGDARAMEALLTEGMADSPLKQKFFKSVFEDRNKLMAAKISDLMKQKKTYFIVVGAGHMVGKGGLVSLLGKEFKVEQM
jgi:uncharacterized protein YbaP (TraB family)